MIIGMLMETSHCLNPVGVTRIAQQKSTRRTHVGSRHTDKETGFCKTWFYLAERMVKHAERLEAQSLKTN